MEQNLKYLITLIVIIIIILIILCLIKIRFKKNDHASHEHRDTNDGHSQDCKDCGKRVAKCDCSVILAPLFTITKFADSIEVHLTPVQCAEFYEVHYKNLTTGDDFVLPSKGETVVGTGLTPANYEISTRSITAACPDLPFKVGQTVAITCSPPIDCNCLLPPPHGTLIATGNGANLTWALVAGATNYRIIVVGTKIGDPLNVVYNNVYTVTTTTFNLSDLPEADYLVLLTSLSQVCKSDFAARFYFTVNACTNTSDCTNSKVCQGGFCTCSPLGTSANLLPTIITSTSNGASHAITVNWTAMSGRLNYRVSRI
ncbi:MAG: hypothetical protein ACMG6E_03695, partial [Candidatus Roizmanbacteria bacterium]